VRILSPLLLIALFAALACTGERIVSGENVVSAIPWTVPEVTRYRLIDDGEEVGSLEMRIEVGGGDSLRLTQRFDFPERGFVNEAEVIVDAGTLLPEATRFRVEGPDGERSCEARYSGGRVLAHHVGQDGERTDELSVPRNSYDSWSDLFLWRTISFSPAFQITYSDILSCTLGRTQNLQVTLKVEEEQTVEVPAGSFDTWRLEIRSGGRTQQAWFATDEERTLVRYDNGDLLFELEFKE
jgi:hypothetical protein